MCPSKTYCTTMVEIKHRPVHKKLTLYHQAVSPAVIFHYCAQLHLKIKIKPIKVGRTPRQFWWFWDVSNVPLMASEGSSGWMDITANSRQMFAPVGGRMGHQNEVCKELQEKLLVGIRIEGGPRKQGHGQPGVGVSSPQLTAIEDTDPSDLKPPGTRFYHQGQWPLAGSFHSLSIQ